MFRLVKTPDLGTRGLRRITFRVNRYMDIYMQRYQDLDFHFLFFVNCFLYESTLRYVLPKKTKK